MPELLKKSSLSKSLILFFTGWGVLALLLAWAGIFYSCIFILYTAFFIGWGRLSLKARSAECKVQSVKESRGTRLNVQSQKTDNRQQSEMRDSEKKSKVESQRLRFFSFLPRQWSMVNGQLFSPIHRHLLLLLVLSFFLASFLSPATIFSGRDEGSIFEASFLLSKSHTLLTPSPEAHAFFDIYGKGLALNFPGFYYTENGALTTQFPTASIAWYASFLSLFGLSGLVIANGILLFLFSFAFTLIVKSFAAPKWTLLGIAILFTSFPIFWFSRFTLSENFFLAFLWLFIWVTYILAEKPTPKKLFLFFLLSALLLFGRIEGIAFFVMAIAFLFWKKEIRHYCAKKYFLRILLPMGILFLLGSVSLLVNTPFYITIAKGFLNGSLEALNTTTNIFSSLLSRFEILFLYGIGLPILIGGISILFFLKKKILSLYLKQNKPPRQQTATPPQEGNNPENSPLWRGAEPSRRGGFPNNTILFLSLWIALPSLLYLFISFISPDHPWMLRRLMFSIIPLFLLFSLAFCVYLESIRYRFFSYAFLILLFLSHISPLLHFFPITSGSDLLKATRHISQAIPKNELLLVDRLASGDGFHMIASPLQTLFDRHAVYFMNPKDLDTLDTSAFSSVALLIPENNISFYMPLLEKYHAEKKEDFVVSFKTLETTPVTELHFPQKTTLEQTVVLYRWNPLK